MTTSPAPRDSFFRAYSDKGLMNFNSAVTKLWLAGEEAQKRMVIRSGAEMTARGLW